MNFEIKLGLKLTKSCPKWEKDRYSETYLDFTTLSHNFWNGVQKNHLQILGGKDGRKRETPVSVFGMIKFSPLFMHRIESAAVNVCSMETDCEAATSGSGLGHFLATFLPSRHHKRRAGSPLRSIHRSSIDAHFHFGIFDVIVGEANPLSIYSPTLFPPFTEHFHPCGSDCRRR